jgi:hypothetical protein
MSFVSQYNAMDIPLLGPNTLPALPSLNTLHLAVSVPLVVYPSLILLGDV